MLNRATTRLIWLFVLRFVSLAVLSLVILASVSVSANQPGPADPESVQLPFPSGPAVK